MKKGNEAFEEGNKYEKVRWKEEIKKRDKNVQFKRRKGNTEVWKVIVRKATQKEREINYVHSPAEKSQEYYNGIMQIEVPVV